MDKEKEKNEFEIETKEFEEVCKPVIEFLRKYYNPMCTAVITDGFSKIVSSEMGIPNEVQD